MQKSFFYLVQQIKKKCAETETNIQKELGLTQAEFAALRLIRPGEILQNGVFAEKMGLSISRGSRVIDQLRKKGYLIVTLVPDNRRCQDISLTDSGESVQTRINELIAMCENSFLEPLPQDMRTQVFENLENIINIMENANHRNDKKVL